MCGFINSLIVSYAPCFRDKKFKRIEALLQEFLKERTLKFIMGQIKQGKKSPQGRRWSADEKSLAMSFYHASPKAYSMLRGLFNLPSESTLKRELRELEVRDVNALFFLSVLYDIHTVNVLQPPRTFGAVTPPLCGDH